MGTLPLSAARVHGAEFRQIFDYAGQPVNGLERADTEQSMVIPGKWQFVQCMVEVVAMTRIDHAMTQQVAKGFAGNSGTVRETFEILHGGRRAFQYGNKAQKRHRVKVTDPVILGSNQRRDSRRGNARQHLAAAHAQHFKILQHPVVVVSLLRDVMSEIPKHTRGQRIRIDGGTTDRRGGFHERYAGADDRVVAEEELGIDFR